MESQKKVTISHEVAISNFSREKKDGQKFVLIKTSKQFWVTIPTKVSRNYFFFGLGCGMWAEPVNGIGIDQDITYIDNEGGVPQWLILS